jgi:hypothetical protein
LECNANVDGKIKVMKKQRRSNERIKGKSFDFVAGKLVAGFEHSQQRYP